MLLLNHIKNHSKKFIMIVILLVILWFCRSFFPMVFLWGSGNTITFHLPDDIEIKDVSGLYYSTNCRYYSIGTSTWNYSLKYNDFNAKKIGANQYQAKVYFKDYSLCQWKLESFSWGFKYKDYKALYPEETNFAENFLDIGSGRSNYLFRYEKFLKENQPSGTETYYITEHFMRKTDTDEYGFYVGLRPYKNHNEGKYGLNTKHIDYTFVLDEPPEVEVSEE